MIQTIAKNVTLNCIHSKKFKDICISINFLNKGTKISATERCLLSMMLVDRCNKYNTKKEMSDMCDHLYGCSLGSRVLTYGKAHCIELRSKIINPVYIHENHNIMNDWLNFIHEVIFNPFIVDGKFDDNLFDENKKILYSRIKRKEDEAQSYTVSRLLDMVKDYPLGIKARGDLESLKNISKEDIFKQYQQLLNEDQIEIIVCGDFDEKQITKQILDKLNFKDRNEEIETFYVIDSNDYGNVKEEKNYSQTNIAILYSTGVSITDKLFPVLKVCNGIFGQLPSSFLFQVVREQHSLCYSISSNLISYDGACIVTTGIEKENVDMTLNLIDEQLKKCQNGEFSDEMLDTTKRMLVNALLSSLDEMSSIVGYNLGNSILNRNYPIEENIQNVMNVSKEDCVQVFNKMKHMATYVCMSKEDVNE